MEGIKNLVKARVKAKNKNIHSEVHYWADIISSTFHERKRFGMYLGVIKRIGVKEAQRIFTEIKDSHAKTPGKLFVWKAGKTGTISSPARGEVRRGGSTSKGIK